MKKSKMNSQVIHNAKWIFVSTNVTGKNTTRKLVSKDQYNFLNTL